MIIGGFGSKTNASLNLTNHKPDIDKIYAKDPYEAKYQLLTKNRESVGLKYLNDLNSFIELLK